MRSLQRAESEFDLGCVVAFDVETLQPTPPEPTDKDGARAFQKWPHHRPLVASFLSAATQGGGRWAFSLNSVVFEQGREAEAFAEIERLLPEIGTVVGHNSRGFDAPVLALSSQAARCHLPKLSRLSRDPRFGRHHADLAELFTNFRSAQTPSLNELSERLGVPCKLEVDGGDVQSLHDQGRIDAIVRYCEQDTAGAMLLFWSWAAWKHADEAKLAEPLGAFSSWVQSDPRLSHLLPFANCPMATWARGRGLVHQLSRAADAAETRRRRDAAASELTEVIDF